MVVFGVAAGLIGSAMLTRFLQTMLFEINLPTRLLASSRRRSYRWRYWPVLFPRRGLPALTRSWHCVMSDGGARCLPTVE
jgi:hypothetical protein